MEQNKEKKAKSEVNLRKLMRKMGMGTNAFAAACGVSTQALAQYLRPGRSLTTATIYNIATALDIDPRDMFFPTDEEENIFSSTEPTENKGKEKKETEGEDAQSINTTAFCPHCGAKVRVGVILMPE